MSSALTRAATAAARAGGTVVDQVRSVVSPSSSRPAGGGSAASGWLAVTLFRPVTDVDPDQLPAPLAEFGDRIEVRVRPAAGDKGTELAVRFRDRPSRGSLPQRLSGEDPQAELRSALRRAKQLIEVGEVLVVDPAPHGERTSTPGGALLEKWTDSAPRAGVR